MAKSSSKLWLSDATKLSFDSIASNKPHAILLVGEAHSGKLFTSLKLAAVLGVDKPSIQIIDDDENSIGVEQSRQLKQLYKLRTAASAPKAVIIHNAEKLTVEAQNAILKLIEEPPKGVHFILTTHRESKLLSTIKSRTARLAITPLNKSTMEEFIKSSYPANTESAKILIAAKGAIGEIDRLYRDTEYRTTRMKNLGAAKEILQASPLERFAALHANAKDKATAIATLADLTLLLRLSLERGIVSGNAKPILNRINLILDTGQRIERNGQVKLQLDFLLSQW